MIHALPLLAPLLLAGASCYAFQAPGLRPRRAIQIAELAALGSIIVAILSGVVLYFHGAGTSPAIGYRYVALASRLDLVSMVMLLLVSFIGWAVLRYAGTYLDGEARQGPFTGWMTATLAGAEAENASLTTQLSGIGAGLGDRDSTIAGLQQDLIDAERLSDEANAQVVLLNQQLAALRTQIAALESALEASESRDAESRTQIADLGRRLNLALAQRVQDLSRYRSDFFGRLRQILETRADVRVVGDRFVFQSEVLFDAGQANVSAAGFPELDALADAILQLEQEIPPDINWVLRIDGHTDKRPISNARFPSNWELSAARAISVAQYLVSKGVAPARLVAAGFGEFAPLDPADTDEAYRRNRRIEFKLTEG